MNHPSKAPKIPKELGADNSGRMEGNGKEDMRLWTTARPVTRGWVVLTVLGLTMAVVGTFLPWLRSGSVYRDSYATATAIDQLLSSDTNLGVLLRIWNGAPPAVTVCVVLFVVGWWRTAAVPAAVLSISMGTVAALLTVQGADAGGLVTITLPGPLTTTVGSALAFLGALGVLVTSRRKRHAPPVQRDREQVTR